MITIKDYAKKKSISYEAARKSVARYKKELGEHVFKNGRTTYLDEEAESFLDEKRNKNPIIIDQQGKSDRIEELEAENEILKNKLLVLQESFNQEILKRDDRIEQLTDKLLAIEEKKEVEPEQVEEEKKSFWKRIFG